MSWSNVKGFNFRESNAFVTDGTNEIPDIGQTYPRSVTIDSDTFNVGWDTDKTLATGTDQVRDRDAAIDRRLAGIAFIGNSSGASKYRINLPEAGQYQVRIAAGDADSARTLHFRVLDNTTQLVSYQAVETATDQWMDATGVVRTSAADWVSNNAALTVTMSTTALIIEIGTVDGSGSNISALSHVSVVQTGGSSSTVTPTTGSVVAEGRAPSVNPFTNVRIREVLINAAGSPVANQTGIHLVVWYGGVPTGAPDLSYSSMTTDANGSTSWSLATGSLVYNQKIFYVAHDGHASLSAYTCAQMIPTYS